ncbi:MAG: hypothetical protein AAB518_01480 [Patescibacteria group bacterium]
MRISNFQFTIYKRENGNSVRGQSLIEILVAVGVGAILVSSAALLLVVSTRVGRESRFIQAASFLSQELMDEVVVFADRHWFCSTTPTCGLYSLQKGPGNPYYLLGLPLVANSGSESITLDSVTYTRSFLVENVIRDSCGIGNITANTASVPSCDPSFFLGALGAGNAEDPSTQKVTVTTTWSSGTGASRLVRYITRNRNELLHQTNWSGGMNQTDFPPGASGISVVNDRFASHTCIDFSTPGSIEIGFPCQ